MNDADDLVIIGSLSTMNFEGELLQHHGNASLVDGSPVPQIPFPALDFTKKET
jgi:hypothetical protein